jgi:3-hydroxyacyl-CoA dehydrogenase
MFVLKAAVAGAGTMGAEIAHVIASAGVPVVLMDTEAGRLGPKTGGVYEHGR